MRILGFTCVLLVVCYVIDFYKRVFDSFFGGLVMECVSCLRFFQSDFGFGFLVFRCFRQLFLGLVLYGFFGLGFKFLEVGWQCWGFSQCFCVLGGVWSELRSGFVSKSCFDGENGSKFSSCEVEDRFLIENVDGNEGCVGERDDENGCTLESEVDVESDSKFSSCELEDRFLIEKVDGNEGCEDERGDENGCTLESNVDVKTDLKLLSCKCGILENGLMIEKCDEDEECVDEGDDRECYDVDEECDVVKLRNLVKIERERANAANVELEKERMAAATAAEETLAMILRLQKEKSVIEMEAHQYRRLTEEKQLHDQEVIESLRWIAMRCQSAGLQLEDEVRSLKQKVELQLKDVEGDQPVRLDKSFSFHNFNFENNALEDKFFSFHNFNFEDDALDNRLVSSLDMALSSCIDDSYLETP